ncbi:MAG: ABC transporter ATP-binding protein [Firmicutes bacterium]|nr:ABC transporter ATP-binding protein [Bacillota bacterium]
MSVLKILNVSKRYNRRSAPPIVAVDNVSFEVNAGEIVGFLGPNGAGKSTTIKMIAGLASPTSGDIEILGESVLKNREKAMQFVGGVIENPDLYLDFSGYKNLMYFASLQTRESLIKAGEEQAYAGLNKRETAKKRVGELLDLVGLSSRAGDAVKKYSLGMKQRLGIAQALLSYPKLLILDEPANGLDPAGIHAVRLLLRKLADTEGMAILVSSHQLAEMQLMCDRVLIINKGKIQTEKTTSELDAEGRTLEEVFLEITGGGF